MTKLADVPKEEYAFEASQEVWDKIQNAENIHEMISEECLQELGAVDVSKRVYLKIKRIADMMLSVMALLVLLVPMMVIAATVYCDNPGPVIFSQYRVGRYGKRFKLYKFRTMKMETPKYLATAELENPEQYITKIGGFLRRTSLDEIPQLINVLKGDMSLVGPRPLISDEYEIHAARKYFGVYNVRPGVTGMAQINGRDHVLPVEKVRMDLLYLHELSCVTDLKILFATIPKVLHRQDVVEGSRKNKKQEVQ